MSYILFTYSDPDSNVRSVEEWRRYCYLCRLPIYRVVLCSRNRIQLSFYFVQDKYTSVLSIMLGKGFRF